MDTVIKSVFWAKKTPISVPLRVILAGHNNNIYCVISYIVFTVSWYICWDGYRTLKILYCYNPSMQLQWMKEQYMYYICWI